MLPSEKKKGWAWAGQRRRRERLGKLVNRISDPFCQEEGAAFPRERKYSGNATFVFVVSNGHTGSTFFGQLMSWRRIFGQVPSDFVIVGESEANKTALATIPFGPDHCQRALEYVADEKLPYMLRALRSRGAHTYFAAGHQIILGLVPALADILGDRAKFVRLRRSRLDTAYSFTPKSAGPCQVQCKYCPCPLDAYSRCPVPMGREWNMLNTFQQYLWAVDEVECQWQALLRSRPHISRIEVNWDSVIEPEVVKRVADFIGMRDVEIKAHETKRTNTHVPSRAATAKNTTLLEQWANEYQQLLSLPECNRYTCVTDVV